MDTGWTRGGHGVAGWQQQSMGEREETRDIGHGSIMPQGIWASVTKDHVLPSHVQQLTS